MFKCMNITLQMYTFISDMFMLYNIFKIIPAEFGFVKIEDVDFQRFRFLTVIDKAIRLW